MDAQTEERVKRHLDQVATEGYTLHRVVVSKKPGCMACGMVNKGKPSQDWTKFMFTIVGQRLDSMPGRISKAYVYSFVLLCADTCLLSPQVHQSLRSRMVELFDQGIIK